MRRYEAPDLHALAGCVGRELAVSRWHLITQERINQFAEVTGDRQWIHLEEERARRESPYGATVAHGYLTLSLLPALSQECIVIHGVRMSVNYGLNRVRFMAPVRAGKEMRARFTLKKYEPLKEGVQVVWQAMVDVKGEGKPACVADMVSYRFPT